MNKPLLVCYGVAWKNEPLTLWRLPELLKQYSSLYFAFGKMFERLDRTEVADEKQPIGQATLAQVEFILGLMRDEAIELGLTAVLERLDRLLFSEKTPIGQCKHDLKILAETIEDEGNRRYFLYIPSPQAMMYQEKRLFGKPVWSAFPLANVRIPNTRPAPNPRGFSFADNPPKPLQERNLSLKGNYPPKGEAIPGPTTHRKNAEDRHDSQQTRALATKTELRRSLV